MLSKVDRYRTMQMMFYPRAMSNKPADNSIKKAPNSILNSNKSLYNQMVNSDSYSKFNKSYQDFQKKLRAVRDGADELLKMSDDIKAPVSKEYGEQLNKKGTAFAEALEDLRNNFINPRVKKTSNTIGKMDKALEEGREYWEKIGVSFKENGGFELDAQKFSEVVEKDPNSVMQGLSKLKGMSGEVKKATNLSQKDKYDAGMAWHTATQPSKYSVNTYTASGRSNQKSVWDAKGSIVDGFL